MKIGQDITGNGQMHVLIQFFADYLPVTSIQPQKPPDIIAKQSFFPDGKEETVHQKDDADGCGKEQKPQILSLLKSFGGGRKVVTFRSRAEADRFIEDLRRK